MAASLAHRIPVIRGNDAAARFKYKIFKRRNNDERRNAEKADGGVKSPEEVLAIAKEYGMEITLEQAQELFDRIKAAKNGELTDEDLDAVVGGGIIDSVKEWFGSLFGK